MQKVKSIQQTIWSEEQLLKFCRSPNVSVSRWAFYQLERNSSKAELGNICRELFGSGNEAILEEVIFFLGETGSAEKDGPPLLQKAEELWKAGSFEEEMEKNFSALLLSLGKLGYEPALPLLEKVLLEHAPEEAIIPDRLFQSAQEAVVLLAKESPQKAIPLLHRVLERYRQRPSFWMSLAGASVRAGDISFLPAVVEYYLSLPLEEREEYDLLFPLLLLGGVRELMRTYGFFGEDETGGEYLLRRLKQIEITRLSDPFFAGFRGLLEKEKLADFYRELYSYSRNLAGNFFRNLYVLEEGIYRDNSPARRLFLCRYLLIRCFARAVKEGRFDLSGTLSDDEKKEKAERLKRFLLEEANALLFCSFLLQQAASPLFLGDSPPAERRERQKLFRLLALPLDEEEKEYYVQRLLPYLDSRDLLFLLRNLKLKQETARERGIFSRQKGKKRLLPSFLKAFPSRGTATRITLMEASAFILEKYARKHPERLLPYGLFLLQQKYSFFGSERLDNILIELGKVNFSFLQRAFYWGLLWEKLDLLDIMSFLPYRAVSRLLKENWERLYCADQELVLYTAMELGDRELIPLVRKVWKKGEKLIGIVLLHLCRLHEEMPLELNIIEKELEEEKKRNEQVERILSSTKSPAEKLRLIQQVVPYVELPLKCCSCSRSYNYKVPSLYVDPETFEELGPADYQSMEKAVSPGCFIYCKNCGAENNYSFTPETYTLVEGELNLIATIDPAPEELIPENYTRIQLMDFAWEKGGEKMSPIVALKYFSRQLEKEPRQVENYLKYAYTLLFFQQERQALQILKEAEGIFPNHPDLYFEQACIYLRLEEFREARFLFRCYLKLKDGGEINEEELSKLKLAREALEYTVGIGKGADKPIVSGKPRVGRNDPCPCGSGKKYKKCCGTIN